MCRKSNIFKAEIGLKAGITPPIIASSIYQPNFADKTSDLKKRLPIIREAFDTAAALWRIYSLRQKLIPIAKAPK